MQGTGAQSDPFLIENATDLYDVRNNMSASVYYELSTSIDLSGYPNWEPIGSPKTRFGAEFDGKGYTISNMSIISASGADSSGSIFVGLFGYVSHSSWGNHIQNLNLYSCYINLLNDSIKFNGSARNIKAGLLAATTLKNNFTNINIISSSISVIKNSPTSSDDSVYPSFSLTFMGGTTISGIVAEALDIYNDEGSISLHSIFTSCSINYLDITGDIYVENISGEQWILASIISAHSYAEIRKSSFSNINVQMKSKYGTYPTYNLNNSLCRTYGVGINSFGIQNSYFNNIILSASEAGLVIGVAEAMSQDFGSSYVNVKFGNSRPNYIYPLTITFNWSVAQYASPNFYYETSSVTSSYSSSMPSALTSSFIGLQNYQMIQSESYIGWDFNVYYWTQSSGINDSYPYLKLSTNLFTGSGILSNPYEIWTTTDLNNIRVIPEFSHYKLMDDLDLSSYESWVPILSPNSNGKTYVAFDGNTKTISNLKITSASIINDTYGYLGLFSYITYQTSTLVYIKNLTLLNPIIDIDFSFFSYDIDIQAGAVCGRFLSTPSQSNSAISNIKVIGFTGSLINCPSVYSSISLSSIASDVGYCTMSLCIVSASQLIVSGNHNIGNISVNGISNQTDDTFIYSCSVIDSYLYGNSSGSEQYINGAFGRIYRPGEIKYSSVKNCNIISIENENYTCFIDGFIGDCYVSASDCYVLNTNITSSGESSVVSGFANYRGPGGSYKNIYISANYSASNVNNIYYISYENVTGLFTSYYESRSNVLNVQALATGLTQSQMQDSASFVGFDFVNVWHISPSNWNDGYPYLSWEHTPQQIITLLYPNGGELFFYNDIIPISWSLSIL